MNEEGEWTLMIVLHFFFPFFLSLAAAAARVEYLSHGKRGI